MLLKSQQELNTASTQYQADSKGFATCHVAGARAEAFLRASARAFPCSQGRKRLISSLEAFKID